MKLSEFLKNKEKLTAFKATMCGFNKANGFEPQHESAVNIDVIDNEIVTIERAFLIAEVENSEEWSELSKEFDELNK